MATSTWLWIVSGLLGIVGFFLAALYYDYKETKKELGQAQITMAEQGRDIENLKDGLKKELINIEAQIKLLVAPLKEGIDDIKQMLKLK